MSRTTILNGNIEICGVEINNAASLPSAIYEAETRVARAKGNLKMIAAATPKDMFPEDENGSTLEKFTYAFDTAMEELEEANAELTKLYIIDVNSENIVDGYDDIILGAK